jgi:cytidine deaminase
LGSAVLTSSGKVYSRSNVENALCGLSTSTQKVANILPDGRAVAPAGDERQMLLELDKNILVVMGSKRQYSTKMVSEIFLYPVEMSE